MSITRHQAVGAYQRWSPPSFDADAPADPEAHDPAAEAPPQQPEPEPPPPEPAPAAQTPADETPPDPPIKLPTADEIEAMFEQARAEGLAAGYEEGKARAREEAERLAAMVGSMDAALDEIDGEVANELVELAVALARQLVRSTLADKPEAIAETVKEALLQLPQGKTKIHVHPDDAKLVREHLADQLEHGHHQLMEDASIARGGSRLEAAGCEIDATIQTRWRRVIEGLGRTAAEWDDNA